ncbi:MAG: NADH-quinone oxidoreductase subunit L, partial [Nitrospirota bacterium]|nr:NADH-quinone oxidoreductase subunit L [Nitrospirota bacterium]
MSGMSSMILVPLLPLAAALFIWVAGSHLRERQAWIGALPIGAAFAGAVLTLAAVSTQGPVSVRFYEPGAGGLALPVGFYFDRLSAVMMTL